MTSDPDDVVEHPFVFVDAFEERSGIPDELAGLGAAVTRAHLKVGDYDVGRGTLVERKTVVDLALSIARGRFWSQIGRLRRRSPFPVFLLEGPVADYPHGEAALRGSVLAVLDQGVAVLWTSSASDSARWLFDLARRRQSRRPRDRPPYAQRPRLPEVSSSEAVLAAIPGLSAHHARALLLRFGTVRSIVAAAPEDWGAVAGIGPVRTRAMQVALHEHPLTPLRREAERSAT